MFSVTQCHVSDINDWSTLGCCLFGGDWTSIASRYRCRSVEHGAKVFLLSASFVCNLTAVMHTSVLNQWASLPIVITSYMPLSTPRLSKAFTSPDINVKWCKWSFHRSEITVSGWREFMVTFELVVLQLWYVKNNNNWDTCGVHWSHDFWSAQLHPQRNPEIEADAPVKMKCRWSASFQFQCLITAH